METNPMVRESAEPPAAVLPEDPLADADPAGAGDELLQLESATAEAAARMQAPARKDKDRDRGQGLAERAVLTRKAPLRGMVNPRNVRGSVAAL
jgi:hypothetical protein